MALPKLFERIFWHNNTTPAINEDNLNAISKGLDDVDNRVVTLASQVMEIVPEIQEYLAQADELVEEMESLTQHPAYIGANGNWWVWSTATSEYVDSGVDASITVQIQDITMVDYETPPYVTNTGTNTDPIFHLYISRAATIASVEKTHTSGNVDTYTMTLQDGTTFDFCVTNGDGSGDMKAVDYDPNDIVVNDGGIDAYVNNVKQTTLKSNIITGLGHSVGAQSTAYPIHAEGTGSTIGANAFNAHTEGRDVKVTGMHAHAEGYETIAEGNEAHAEGNSTLARGWHSHAEGYDTTSSGNASHAEGNLSKAYGDASHVEGYHNISEGRYAHAEGNSTTIKSREESIGLMEIPGLVTGDIRNITPYENDPLGELVETLTVCAPQNSTPIISLNVNDFDDFYNFFTLQTLMVVDEVQAVLDPTGHYTNQVDLTTLQMSNYSRIGQIDVTYKFCQRGLDLQSVRIRTDFKVWLKDKYVVGTDTYYMIEIWRYWGDDSPQRLPLGYQVDAVLLGIWASISDVKILTNTIDDNESKGSHVEGYHTLVENALYAHAEGASTTAIGDASHAEGNNSSAVGEAAHAEGYNTIAVHSYSHAQGNQGEARGKFKYQRTQAVGKATIDGKPITFAHGIGKQREADEHTDPSQHNGFSVDDNGNFYTTGAQTMVGGYIDGVLVANGVEIVLEDGACYLLYVNGRNKTNGQWRGAQTFVIDATFNPTGLGQNTTAQAVPHIQTLGTVGTTPVSLAARVEAYTAPHPSTGATTTFYHSKLGIGSCQTQWGVRWNLIKVLGSEDDFTSEV